LRADVLFIRAQSAIRADGPPSAQVRSLQLEVPPTSADVGTRLLRAARANPVFYTDKKRIRIENRVMDKSNNGLSLLFIQNWNSATTAGGPKQRPACAGLSLRI